MLAHANYAALDDRPPVRMVGPALREGDSLTALPMADSSRARHCRILADRLWHPDLFE